MVEDVIEKPAKSANKPDWVAFAVSQGMDEDDAEAMSKPALIAFYEDDEDGDEDSVEDQIEDAVKAGEAMTAPGAPAAVKAGAEPLPPELRAAAFHRPIKPKS